MSTLFFTLLLTFLVIIIAFVLLGFGLLITGKPKIRPGACGRDPNKKFTDVDGCEVDTSCLLCKKTEKEEK